MHQNGLPLHYDLCIDQWYFAEFWLQKIFLVNITIMPKPKTKVMTIYSSEVSKPRDMCLDFPIALKVDRQLSNSATDKSVEFQSDTIMITSNLAASTLHEILR